MTPTTLYVLLYCHPLRLVVSKRKVHYLPSTVLYEAVMRLSIATQASELAGKTVLQAKKHGSIDSCDRLYLFFVHSIKRYAVLSMLEKIIPY